MRRPRVYDDDAVTTVNAAHWDGVFLPKDPSKPPKLVWWRNGVRGELTMGNRCACHPGTTRCPVRAYVDAAARYLRDVVDKG